MSTSHLVESVGAVAVVSVAAADVILPDAAAWTERLGTVGVLVVAGVLAVRWLVAQLEKKDVVIAQITANHEATSRANQDVLLKELREGYEVKRLMSAAMQELTQTLRSQNRERG